MRLSRTLLAAGTVLCLFIHSTPALAADFHEIRRNMEAMTEVQFASYSETFIGQRVTWTGWVSEVTEGWSATSMQVRVDMDPPGTLSVYDLDFSLPRQRAMSLIKNRRVTVSGTIRRIRNILGACSVELDKAVVSQ